MSASVIKTCQDFCILPVTETCQVFKTWQVYFYFHYKINQIQTLAKNMFLYCYYIVSIAQPTLIMLTF